ncbi:MAG: hypothetical protein J7556_14895 [Acidovorax sp.]|nr:hypothetical protein [Acidovorax sp.]
MTTTPRLQYTDVRTRMVDGKPLIGLRHRAKAAGDMPISTAWVEMPPEDVVRLIRTLQDTLAELDGGIRPAGYEQGNG